MGLEKGCPCYKVYKEDKEFIKVMQLENAGVVIYRYIPTVNNENSVSQPEKTLHTNDIFIIHNTTNVNVSTSNHMSEFEQAINCPRCRYIVKHTKELLLNVPFIQKKDVIGICDHCRFKKRINERCNKCQLVVEEFLKKLCFSENIALPNYLNESSDFVGLDYKHQQGQKFKPKIELDFERLPSTELGKYLKKENDIFSPIYYGTERKVENPKETEREKEANKIEEMLNDASKAEKMRNDKEIKRQEEEKEKEKASKIEKMRNDEEKIKRIEEEKEKEKASKIEKMRNDEEKIKSKEEEKEKEKASKIEKMRNDNEKIQRKEEEKEKDKASKIEKMRNDNEKIQRKEEEKEKDKASKIKKMRNDKEKIQRKEEEKEKEKANKTEKMRNDKEKIQRKEEEKEKEKASKIEKMHNNKEKIQRKEEEKEKEKASKIEKMRNDKEKIKRQEEEKEKEKASKIEKTRNEKGKLQRKEEEKEKEKANKTEKMHNDKEKIQRKEEGKEKEKAYKSEKNRNDKEAEQKGKNKNEKQEAQLLIKEKQKPKENEERPKPGGKERHRHQKEENENVSKDREEFSHHKLLKQHIADRQKYRESIQRKQQEEESKKKDLYFNQVKIRKNSDDDILQLVKFNNKKGSVKERPTRMSQINIPSEILSKHMEHKNKKTDNCIICLESDLELDIENIRLNETKPEEVNVTIVGTKILKCKPSLLKKKKNKELKPLFYNLTQTEGETNIKETQEIKENIEEEKGTNTPIVSARCVEQESPKGIIRYALSDRTFIEKGWTMLPTEKVVRKMNVYRMRPAHPEFDWFEHNKSKKLICYDTGEKLAEFDDNGKGRWYYRSGKVALDYYDAEEINAQHRIIIYSSGEPDERGRSRPFAILATFDCLGNGIVFDHSGKLRLKYNQNEGVVLDRAIGPVSHWKWHSLNDPPVLQQVMIDTQMTLKDPKIRTLGKPGEDTPRPDNEEMLSIEFDNFIKEKSKKLSQEFKPFQIKMKALKINEYFSLKILDQATVYLIYRDGSTNLKLNIGMILDHQEIVDTETAEMGEVLNSLERFPAQTDSLAGLQKSVAQGQRVERARVERMQRLRPAQPCASTDRLVAGLSRPLRPLPLGQGVCQRRKPATCNLYYNTCLI